MYKYGAKKWCPKDLCPTNTSMGKAKRDFPSFADVGQRCKREKNHLLEFVQKTHSKAMTPDLPVSVMSLPNRPLSQFGGSSHLHGGKTNHSTTPWGWIQEYRTKFWLTGLTRNTLGKTAARLSMVKDFYWKKQAFKKGVPMYFWCKRSFCGQEEGAYYQC